MKRVFMTLALLAACVLSGVGCRAASEKAEPPETKDALISAIDESSASAYARVTVKECAAVALRLSRAASGKSASFPSGTDILDAAEKEGVLRLLTVDDPDGYISRADAAVMLANALPDSYKPLRAPVTRIRDVEVTAVYYPAVFSLCRAGVLHGEYFRPDEPLRRADLTAMLAGLYKKDAIRETDNAYYIIDDVTLSGKWGLQGGWTYDNKYQIANTTGMDSYCVTPSDSGVVSLTRRFETETSGQLDWSTAFTLGSAADGLNLRLLDASDEPLLTVSAESGKFVLYDAAGVMTKTSLPASAAVHTLIARIDLDGASAHVFLDAKDVGELSLGNDPTLAAVRCDADKGGIGSCTLSFVRLTKNYAVNDVFLASAASEGSGLFGGWETNGDVTVRKMLSETGNDIYSARMAAPRNSDVFAFRPFEPLSGKVIAECYVLLPHGDNGAYVTLTSSGNDAVTVTTEDNNFLFDGYPWHFTDNVWQNVRIEADTETGVAVAKINGKTIGECSFDAAHIDGIRVGISPSADTEMWFDDVKVSTYTEPDDYPSEPDAVNLRDGYNIGVNVCNLWRQGYIGEGWDVILPFDDLVPYLGFYDEGTPEAADWECKWMAEHGIDFQHICWYAPNALFDAPIKGVTKPQIALDDGYFNGKYSDHVNFCIMWENDSCHRDPAISDEEMMRRFKEVVWPFFMDHYFSDPRIMTLDGKALMTIYKVDEMEKFFGSVEKAAEAVGYMREQVKSLGFDDLCLWFCDNGSVNKTRFQKSVAVGGDAVYTYNFGTEGCRKSYQFTRLDESMAQTFAPYIPTVSVGFNAVGRHDNRTGMITLDDYRDVCERIRDDYLPRIRTGTWRDSTIMLSTWNEFSEGTYIAPTNLNGFGYLDVVRDVFSDSTPHTDELPTANALHRVQRLYTHGRDSIRKLQYDVPNPGDPIEGDPTLSYDFSNASDRDKWGVSFGIGDYYTTTTSICGTASQFDFAVKLKSGIPGGLDIAGTYTDTLHVRMKSDRESFGELFFLTSTDKTWDAAKSAKFTIEEAGVMRDYYVDLSKCASFGGVLTDLRFDPMQGGGTFEIETIEFISSLNSRGSGVCFDGEPMTFDYLPIYDAALDDKFVTANPRMGFFSMLHTTYYYDKAAGTVRVDSPAHSVTFTVGAKTAVRDGENVDLGYMFRLRDGLPLFPVKHLAALLGYPYTEKDGVIDVQTLDDELRAELENVRNGYFTFDNGVGLGAWTFQHSEGSVSNGVVHITATGTDPAFQVTGLHYDLEKFTKVIIRVRYECDRSIPFAQLFFRSDSDTAFSEAHSKKLTSLPSSSGGEYVDLVFDLSSVSGFTGVLTALRFDPFNGLGTYDIDSVRLA